MLHGHLNMLIMAWDLVADHPSISPAERRRIGRRFSGRVSHAGRTRPHCRMRAVSGPSAATTARGPGSTPTSAGGTSCAALPGGRRPTLAEIADGMFAPMLESAKPGEDSWGHQWACSLFNTVVYGLADGKGRLSALHRLRQAADRALIAHGYAQPPLVYLAACAVATGDTGYLSSFPRGRFAAAGRGHARPGRRVSAKFPDRPAGRAAAATCWAWPWRRCAALVRHLRGRAERQRVLRGHAAAGGVFRQDLDPRGLGSRRLLPALGRHLRRRPRLPGCQLHCPVPEQGVAWLASAYRETTSATVRSENGVFVALDSAGPGQVHATPGGSIPGRPEPWPRPTPFTPGWPPARRWKAWATLTGNGTSSAAAALDPGDRRAQCRRAGEALVERHWHSGAKIQARRDGTTARCASGHSACKRSARRPTACAGATIASSRCACRRPRGKPCRLATLLHDNPRAAAARRDPAANGRGLAGRRRRRHVLHRARHRAARGNRDRRPSGDRGDRHASAARAGI